MVVGRQKHRFHVFGNIFHDLCSFFHSELILKNGGIITFLAAFLRTQIDYLLTWFLLVFSLGRQAKNTSIMFLATTSMIYDLFFTANHDFRSSSGNFSIEYRNMVLGIWSANATKNPRN